MNPRFMPYWQTLLVYEANLLAPLPCARNIVDVLLIDAEVRESITRRYNAEGNLTRFELHAGLGEYLVVHDPLTVCYFLLRAEYGSNHPVNRDGHYAVSVQCLCALLAACARGHQLQHIADGLDRRTARIAYHRTVRLLQQMVVCPEEQLGAILDNVDVVEFTEEIFTTVLERVPIAR